MYLRRAGILLREINIWDDPAGAPVRWVARGKETVPTVVIGDVALVNPEHTPRADRAARPGAAADS